MKVAVIGNIFVDVKGISFGLVNKDAKNVGKAVFSHGGVGRNVAQNLSALGLNTTFLSSVTNNAIGKEVMEKLKNYDVNTNYIRWCDEDGMGLWLAILDYRGDLVCSISHQPDYRYLEETVFEFIDEVAENHDALALDVDLTLAVSEKVIEVCRRKKKPLYGVVGNLSVVRQKPALLKGLSGFVCSKEEAELLLNVRIETQEDAQKAVIRLAREGCPRTVITLGSEGSVFYDAEQDQFGYCPAKEVRVKDTTGAGDAFFSGWMASLVRGGTMVEAMEHGTRAAATVIQMDQNALIPGHYVVMG